MVPSTPLIFKLHKDDLLHIFEHITLRQLRKSGKSARSPTPLETIRHASQVCRSWRYIVIGSPSIWGNMVDINLASTAKRRVWFDEVMERTKNAPLSVYGNVYKTPNSEMLFTDLMVNQWHRIRSVDITFEKAQSIDKKVWDKILTPASILESFTLRGAKYGHWPMTLFSDSAPLLCHISRSGIQDHRTTWMHQLTSVVLSHPLTTLHVLKIISRAPLLESLTIRDPSFPEDPEAQNWTAKIDLPHLRLLDISLDSFRQSLVYFQNIITKPDCGLAFSSSEWDSGQEVLYYEGVANYVENHFRYNTPTMMVIDLQNPVEGGRGSNILIRTSGRQILKLYIDFHNIIGRHHVFNALSSIHLCCLTEIEFLSNDFPWINPDDSDFKQFLSFLQSVKTATMTLPTVKMLSIVALHRPVLLPALQHIKLKSSRNGSQCSPGYLQLLLSRRKASNTPILSLDISEQKYSVFSQFMMDYFDDFGITVKANDFQLTQIRKSV